jgi:ribose transport system ATP-binding protein
MLSAINITKKFSGVVALDNVSLDLQSGKVNAIIGENGAGKSTLMKILSGVYTDYEGVIELNNQAVKFKGTKDAQDKGIAIIHQELNLIPELSIVENIFLGREITNRFGILDKAKMGQITEGVLKKLHLDMAHPDRSGIDPNTKVKDLKVGQQQLIEIAKALLLDAKVIIMDEPTSAITGAEVAVLFDIINELKKEGKAIAYISHKLDELFEIADTYTVLRDGKSIDSGNIKDVSKDILISKMVGRDLEISKKASPVETLHCNVSTSNLLLNVKNLRILKFNNSLSFSLKHGEILGVFGLMGAGRTELLETLFGLKPTTTSGEIFIKGEKKTIKSPSDAVKAGLAFVTEDRKKDGIIPELSVKQNISLTTLFNVLKNGILNPQKENDLAEKYIQDLKIKAASNAQLIKTLSGGNQQKAILAKWLATKPQILLLDEPTRGIDINAKAEIYTLIKELAETGLGIIMVSSELPEILAVSDRVLVLSEGKLTGDFGIDEATEEKLLKAAIV